ncbi:MULTISPECIES: hypothetical protein [Helicobacter]|uniref:hypothetical protein n=1 Tax=Helicobacter TaxID=209 RepID=UPI0026364D6C|nr:hypothetical protein [Helicobacter sp. UBA3407]
MTPIVLQELFNELRRENLSFCVTNLNYNKVMMNRKSQAQGSGGGALLELLFILMENYLEKLGILRKEMRLRVKPLRLYLKKW